MDIEALSLFVRAAERGNITAAGKELGHLPSVASQKLLKLEKTLGMRLLSRTTRHISLTEDVRAFIPYARSILTAVDEAYSVASKGGDSPRRTLKISAPGSFARRCLFPAIGKFLIAHPNLNINLVLSDALQDLTEIGIDVAIRIAELKSSTLVALGDHRRIVFDEEEPWRFIDVADCRQAAMDSVFRTNCGESVRLAAAHGLGIASISLWNAKAALERGELVQVLGDFELQQKRDIWAIYPSNKLISSKARLFVEFLVEECEGEFNPQPVHHQKADDVRRQR